MEDAELSVTLDLNHRNKIPVIRCKRGDTARLLKIRLCQGGEPYAIDPGCLAVLTGRKPDRTTLYNTCEILDNVIIYPFTAQTTSCMGTTRLEVRLYGGENQRITSAPLMLEVYAAAHGNGEAARSRDEQTALDNLITDSREVNEQASAALKELQDKLDSREFYGDSAYESAVKQGYPGTEEQWVESLRYDHSDEFVRLEASVKENAERAESAADRAGSAVVDAVAREHASMLYITAPALSAMGETVTCRPVRGEPLTVYSLLGSSGAGSTEVNLTQSSYSETKHFHADLPRRIFSGRLEWNTWKVVELFDEQGNMLEQQRETPLPGRPPVIVGMLGDNTFQSDTGMSRVICHMDPADMLLDLRSRVERLERSAGN